MELIGTLARNILSTPCWALERRNKGLSDLDACWYCDWQEKEGRPGMVKDHVLFWAPGRSGPSFLNDDSTIFEYSVLLMEGKGGGVTTAACFKYYIIILGGNRCQQGKFNLFFIKLIGLNGFSIFVFFIPGSWEGKQWETCKGGKVVGRDA
jgi:hypothetical protein